MNPDLSEIWRFYGRGKALTQTATMMKPPKRGCRPKALQERRGGRTPVLIFKLRPEQDEGPDGLSG